MPSFVNKKAKNEVFRDAGLVFVEQCSSSATFYHCMVHVDVAPASRSGFNVAVAPAV